MAHAPSRITPWENRLFQSESSIHPRLDESARPAVHALKYGRLPRIADDLAVAMLWLLAFSKRPLTCQIGAADQDQADEMRQIMKGVRHSSVTFS